MQGPNGHYTQGPNGRRLASGYQESVFLFRKEPGIPDLLKMLNDKGNEVIGHKENPGTYRVIQPR
jgi:hypothetical protein